MKKLLLVSTLGLFGLLSSGLAQTVAPKQLTIEQIFGDGGVTGRAPETIKWSPDGTRVSFVQRDNTGEHGELWYVDALTGENGSLVSEIKLSQLAPPVSRIADEREKERVTRYHVAAYSWSPDSKHLLFDSQGQLWYYSLNTGTAVQLTSSPDPSEDPKFSPDGKRLAYVRKHNLYVHPVSGEEGERPITRDEKEKDKDRDKDKDDRHPEWGGGLGLRRRTGGAQQFLLVAGREGHYFSPDGREPGADLPHHRLAPDSSPGRAGKISARRAIRIPACVWEW